MNKQTRDTRSDNKKPYGKGGKPHHKKARKHEPRPKMGPKIKANLWGLHACEEALRNPERDIKDIYLTDKTAEQFATVLDEVRQDGLKRPEPKLIDKKDMDRLGSNVVHQGIALFSELLPEIQVQDLVSLNFKKDRATILILDQVTDPHNVGAILRSAAAFGVSGMIMQTRHAPQIDGILAKTACGGAEHVPVAFETNLSRSLEVLQGEGYQAIALDERGDNLSSTNIKPGKVVLILGSEGKGLRPKIKEQCDKLVRLPTEGAIQSLNVSNAAAIALYALKAVQNS